MEPGQAVFAVLDAMQRAWAEEDSYIVVASLSGDHIETALIVGDSTGHELFRSAAVHDVPSTTSEAFMDGVG